MSAGSTFVPTNPCCEKRGPRPLEHADPVDRTSRRRPLIAANPTRNLPGFPECKGRRLLHALANARDTAYPIESALDIWCARPLWPGPRSLHISPLQAIASGLSLR